MLRFEDVYMMHSPGNYSRQFGSFVEAWRRQLPQLTCALKFEDGRLLRRLAPERRGEQPKWEEDDRIQPDVRWLKIPEVISNTDIETLQTITALVFLGWATSNTNAGARPMRSCSVKKQNRPSKNRQDSCLQGKDSAKCWWK